VHEWVSEWVNDWVSEWMSQWKSQSFKNPCTVKYLCNQHQNNNFCMTFSIWAQQFTIINLVYIFPWHNSPAPSRPGPPYYWRFIITLNRTPLDEWLAWCTGLYLTIHNTHKRHSLMHRPLPDNTQHSQETDIHAPGMIQTHNPR